MNKLDSTEPRKIAIEQVVDYGIPSIQIVQRSLRLSPSQGLVPGKDRLFFYLTPSKSAEASFDVGPSKDLTAYAGAP